MRNCPVFDPRKYKVYSNQPIFKEQEQQQLKSLLTIHALPLWNTMVLVAKDFKLVHKYREAAFALNCAFENFIETEISVILKSYMGEEVAEKYLKGSVIYDDFRLKKYLTRKQFEEAVNSGLVEMKPPSTKDLLIRMIQNGLNLFACKAVKLTFTGGMCPQRDCYPFFVRILETEKSAAREDSAVYCVLSLLLSFHFLHHVLCERNE